jgi:hypothetical protein
MAAGIVFVGAGVNDFLPARPPKPGPGLVFRHSFLAWPGLAVAGGLGYNLKKIGPPMAKNNMAKNNMARKQYDQVTIRPKNNTERP